MTDDPKTLTRPAVSGMFMRFGVLKTQAMPVVADAGGAVMTWWALVLIACNLLICLRLVGIVRVSLPIGLIELGAGCIGNAVLLAMRGRVFGNGTWQSGLLSFMWFGAGLVSFLFIAGTQAMSILNPQANFAVVALCCAGIMAVTAMMTQKRWVGLPAASWAAVALGVFLLQSGLLRSVVFALGATLFMLIPGLLLWREQGQGRS